MWWVGDALHECSTQSEARVQQLQEGTILAINVKIEQAGELKNTLQQQMDSTQTRCRVLLARVHIESDRTSQIAANLNQINDKIDIVQRAILDWSVKVDQHQLQSKDEIDAFKNEQSQK